ncbi:class I SAM-dependent methyltransferase [Streptomyces sp. NPDC004266]|uniref:class I SAM-dependent methyltransferase n=1 Tax=Streptomyces sp. NPDC004266 TaxID=3364693 RepID=UPI0036ABAC75
MIAAYVRRRPRRKTGAPHHERAVAGDLREDWAAAPATAGHDPAVPTPWIAEGLLILLPEDAVGRPLGATLSSSSQGQAAPRGRLPRWTSCSRGRTCT